MNIQSLTPVMLATVLAACSTPQVALDQANHTVKLTEQLRTEVSRYRKNLSSSAERRIQSLSQTKDVLILVTRETATLDSNRRTAGGKEPDLAFESTLRTLVAITAEISQQEKEQRDEFIAIISGLPKDIDSPDSKLEAVQSTMAALGEELPRKTRILESVAFVKEIKKISEANGKKADESAAKPPTPAASSVAPAASASN